MSYVLRHLKDYVFIFFSTQNAGINNSNEIIDRRNIKLYLNLGFHNSVFKTQSQTNKNDRLKNNELQLKTQPLIELPTLRRSQI